MPLNADNYGLYMREAFGNLFGMFFFNAFKIPDFEDDIVKQSD